jgi:hypothetical protein
MTFDLRSALPHLLPKAIAWAEIQSENAARTGRPLDELFISIAKCVGVANPQHIRILDVPYLLAQRKNALTRRSSGPARKTAPAAELHRWASATMQRCI